LNAAAQELLEPTSPRRIFILVTKRQCHMPEEKEIPWDARTAILADGFTPKTDGWTSRHAVRFWLGLPTKVRAEALLMCERTVFGTKFLGLPEITKLSRRL
jgi:hypothetical protein